MSYRAWRFVHPDEAVADGLGDTRPGFQLTAAGRIQMVAGAGAVRQAILLLLETAPGERVMRPDYGCHLQRLLFAPNDETTAGLAIHYVRRAIQRWEPRVEILRLDAQTGNDPGILEIHLDYRVRASQQVASLVYAFDLAGEES
jgi:phage baseplate assembly protein W